MLNLLRLSAIAFVALVAALGVAACGSGDSGDDDEGDSLTRRERNATATARAGDDDERDDDDDADATATARAEDDDDGDNGSDDGDPNDECDGEAADPDEDWVLFEGGGAELFLPPSYEGGDVATDVEVIVERLRAQGPDFEELAQIIEANPDLFVLLAFDTEATDFGTNVNITRQDLLSRDTLESSLDDLADGLPDSFQIRRREIVCRGENRAGRIVVDATVGTTEISELFYMVVEDATLWTITYAAGAEEYDALAPVFEQSMETLRVEAD